MTMPGAGEWRRALAPGCPALWARRLLAGLGFMAIMASPAQGESSTMPSHADMIRGIHDRGGSVITAFREAGIAAPDLEWWVAGPPDRLAFAGSYAGLEGVEEFQRRLNGTVRYDRLSVLEYIVAEDQVGVLFEGEGIALATGKPFRSKILRLYTFRDGLVVRVRNFFDTAAYVAALEDGGHEGAAGDEPDG